MEMGSVVIVQEWGMKLLQVTMIIFFLKSTIQLLPHFRHEVLSICQKYIIIGYQESLMLSDPLELKTLVCVSLSQH